MARMRLSSLRNKPSARFLRQRPTAVSAEIGIFVGVVCAIKIALAIGPDPVMIAIIVMIVALGTVGIMIGGAIGKGGVTIGILRRIGAVGGLCILALLLGNTLVNRRILVIAG